MHRIKRQRIDDCITKFEYLSNDMIYEIFDYLDAYQIYESFYFLNIRFQELICASTLRLNIGHVSLSKPIFDRFYEEIVLKNLHRISSFTFAEPMNIFYIPLLLQNTSKFLQLKSIQFDNIDLNYVKNTLNCLAFLPTLYSLVIHCDSIDSSINTTELFQSIFQLSTLCYCEVRLDVGIFTDLSPISDEQSSLIENFRLSCQCTWQFLAAFLSYVPRLRHLSVGGLCGDSHNQVELFSNVSNRLIDVSLCLLSIQFDQFIQLSKKLFSNLRILRLSICDRQYINATQWEQLIRSSMPYLRSFDIQCTQMALFNQNDNSTSCQTIMNEFKSSFWTERQWFFTHRHNYGKILVDTFYSTKPYRRETYVLNGKYDDPNRSLHEKESSYTHVRHLILKSKEAMENCSIYFSNVTKIEMSINCPVNLIARLVPLSKIYRILITCEYYPFEQLLELFTYTSNCKLLMIKSLLHKNESISTFQNNTSTRQLKELIIQQNYITIECITLIIQHFNCLKQIVINSKQILPQSVVHHLLTKTRIDAPYLCSLQISSFNQNEFQSLRTFIKSNKILDNYIIKYVGKFCYINW